MGIAAAAAAALDGGLYFFCVPLHGPYLSGARDLTAPTPLGRFASPPGGGGGPGAPGVWGLGMGAAARIAPRFCRMAKLSGGGGDGVGEGPTCIIGSSGLRYCMVIAGCWVA